MSASKRTPRGLIQKDEPDGLAKLEEFQQIIGNLDRGFNEADIRSALKATEDSYRVGETIGTIRVGLESLLQKLEFRSEEPGYRVGAVRTSDVGKLEKAERTQIVSYSYLQKLLKHHQIELPLPKGSLNYWKDLQIQKIPTWFGRLKTWRRDIMPTTDLDVHVELFENALRRISAYGKDFEIDRDRITYEGNLQALLNALKRDSLEGVIVETYPQTGESNLLTWVWLIKNCTNTARFKGSLYRDGFYDDLDPRYLSGERYRALGGGHIVDEVCGEAKIKFLFKVTPANTEIIAQQIANRGARSPNLTELLFVHLGASKPNGTRGLKEDIVYKIDNDFKPRAFSDGLGIYFVYGINTVYESFPHKLSSFDYQIFDESSLSIAGRPMPELEQQSLYVL